jgi:hypothetical protein
VKGKKKVDGSNHRQKKFGKLKNDKRNGKNKKNRTKSQGKGKGKAFKYHKCDGPNYFAKKCRIPQYLVELHQRFIKESNNVKRLYETHFNDETKEATILRTIPSNPEMPKMTDNDDMDTENTIVEYNSNDVFGDLK